MLTNYELTMIKGGATTLSYSLINALTKAVSTIFAVGRSIGSSLRRIVTGNFC